MSLFIIQLTFRHSIAEKEIAIRSVNNAYVIMCVCVYMRVCEIWCVVGYAY